MTGQEPAAAVPLPARVEVGGMRCSTCTIDDLVALVADRLRGEPSHQGSLSVLCVNAHVFNCAWEDPELHARLEAADVVALDGMAMVWAVRRLAGVTVERCNMTEALRAFLTDPSTPDCRAVVIGVTPDVVERAAAAITDAAPMVRVVDALDGYRDVGGYVDAVADHAPDLVLVGCGTPRSEAIVTALAADGRARVVWHVGGGTLRFLAGDRTEAPAWMRRSGLQWAHRLAVDPAAMWRRYLVGNPRFIRRVWAGAPRPGDGQ